MLPEVAAKTSGVLRAKLSMLPIAEQERLLLPEAVLLVALPGGDSALISPMRLTGAQVGQVFGDGYIRELAEQRAVMDPQAKVPGESGRKKGSTVVRVDPEKGCVEYYGHTITKAVLRRWLAQL